MAQTTGKNCPICDKASDVTFHPFCSQRCAQIDLNRWFGEHYTIPTEEDVWEDERQGYESGLTRSEER